MAAPTASSLQLILKRCPGFAVPPSGADQGEEVLSQVLQCICCAGIAAALAPSHSRWRHLVCVCYCSPCKRSHLGPKLFIQSLQPSFCGYSHSQKTEGSILDHKCSQVDVSPWETPMASFPQLQVGSHKSWEKPHSSGVIKAL